jgi:hypothetical protein
MGTPVTPQPGEPAASWTPPAAGASQPALPDLSEFVNKPGKPPKKSNAKTGLYVGMVVGGLVLAGAGYFIGTKTASGPATLAAAVADAQAGKLPCGTPTTSATPDPGQGFGQGGGGVNTFLIARLCQSGNGTGTGLPGAGGGPGTGGGPGAGNGFPGGGGGGFGGGGALGGLIGPGTVTGTLTKVTSTSLTITTRGGSVTVALPSAAKVTTTTSGSVSDLAAGQTVAVGTTTSGSAQTATSVFVLPASTTSGTAN